MVSVIFAISVGCFFIYKAKKTNAKLLAWAGLMIILIWTYYFGNFLDFITILLTGTNIENTSSLLGSLNWMWPALGSSVQIYFTAKIIIPEKKSLIRIVTYIYLIIMAIALLLLFLTPSTSFIYFNPDNPGEDLIYFHLLYPSPIFYVAMISIIYVIIFVVVGFSIKSLHSTSILKKKYLFSSLAVLICSICKIIEALFYFGIISIFTKIADLIGGVFWYLSLREESAEPKMKPEKKIQVEEGIFRLTKRPENITEDEVMYFKEQKICLVCKNKVLGLTYICPECDALYCVKCSKALSDLENACWSCNAPFDKSKPTESFKKREEDTVLELIEKPKKKLKGN